MGGGSWTTSSWDAYSTTRNVRHASTVGSHDSLYSSRSMPTEYDPKNIVVRESCDSAEHPNSTPIIIACDVTGSMSPVLRSVMQNLGTMNDELNKRNPVSDPQVCYMGIGDVAAGDRAPLQVTQFESDIRQAEALSKIWLEQRGGSNSSESYILPWYFALNKVKADAIEKRGKKGFLFTMGDECCPNKLTAGEIETVFGERPQEDNYTKEELLSAVSRDWEVFHLIIEEGNYYSNRYYRDSKRPENVNNSFEFMGQNVIHVSDHTKIAEIIVSTIQVVCGENVEKVIDSWDGSTSIVVKHAIESLTNVECSSDLVEF